MAAVRRQRGAPGARDPKSGGSDRDLPVKGYTGEDTWAVWGTVDVEREREKGLAKSYAEPTAKTGLSQKLNV